MMLKTIILSFLIPINLTAMSKPQIQENNITTSIGDIKVYQQIVPNTTPIILLHGVYYDHNLWNYYTSRITDRTVITIDMPHHGKSKHIKKKNWNMNDCKNMLLEIIDSLAYKQVYAIGHSWGSMTILRAASEEPSKFKAIGFCNMPFQEGNRSTRLKFSFQHFMLSFRTFYTKQVVKAMFGKEAIQNKPEAIEYLDYTMSLLTNKEVKQTDKAVISHVDNGEQYLSKLTVKVIALKGKDDYVETPKNIHTTIVEGSHTSPLEQPQKVLAFIKQVLAL